MNKRKNLGVPAETHMKEAFITNATYKEAKKL